MDDEEDRKRYLKTITAAPLLTLQIIADCISSAEQAPSHLLPIRTEIAWNRGGAIKISRLHELLYQSTPHGLAQEVWYSLILEKKRSPKFTAEKLLSQLRYLTWYQRSQARTELEQLCLQGCGRNRADKSAYCSTSCRQAFWKWIEKQIAQDDKTIRTRMEFKRKRFQNNLWRLKHRS